MLKIVKSLSLPRAQNTAHGDIQTMLERVLIEVVSANYRYFLHERLMWAETTDDRAETACWPPLLANERQVSGLFAHALSSVCPVSRPELGITRSQKKDREDAAEGARDPNGRIDYYATYGRRSVAVELKRVTLATSSDSKRAMVRDRWDSVGRQAQSALNHMRTEPADYPHAVGVGILVVRLFRSVTARADPVATARTCASRVTEIADELSVQLRPDLLATYTPPAEMQISDGWETGSGVKVFPGVIFAATVRVRAS